MYKVVNVKELGKESKKTNEVKDNSKLTDKEIQHEIKDFHFKIPNIFSILYNLINKI
jgi:hypothetical protein